MSTHADIMFWAFRYALPRHTYAVNEVATYIARHVDDLDPKARALMVKEIDEQLAADCNLWQCDRDDWARLREALTKHKPPPP